MKILLFILLLSVINTITVNNKVEYDLPVNCKFTTNSWDTISIPNAKLKEVNSVEKSLTFTLSENLDLKVFNKLKEIDKQGEIILKVNALEFPGVINKNTYYANVKRPYQKPLNPSKSKKLRLTLNLLLRMLTLYWVIVNNPENHLCTYCWWRFEKTCAFKEYQKDRGDTSK
jgi:hypothetical protein